MAKMESKWVALKGKRRGPRYGLRCKDCENRFLLVIEEPVARKVKSKTAHRRRVIAMCPLCRGEYRLKLGPSH